MNIKKITILGIFLCIGSTAFAQKTTGHRFKFMNFPTQTKGFIVMYATVDSAAYTSYKLPKKWTTLGNEQKPLSLPTKNKKGEIIYRLNGLELNSYYFAKIILVYEDKMHEEIICRFTTGDTSDEDALLGIDLSGCCFLKTWKKKTDQDLKQQRK